MEVRLEQLINKIKQEGVVEAQKKSDELLLDAQNETKLIIDDAEKQAQRIKDEAKKEAEQTKNSTEAALKQSARDVLLMVKQQLVEMFDESLKKVVSTTLSPEIVKDLIAAFIKEWAQNKDVSIEVLVSREDRDKIEELLYSQLKEELRSSIDIKVNNAIDKGFRIGIRDENVYYDLSDESIVEALKAFLSPSLTNILNN